MSDDCGPVSDELTWVFALLGKRWSGLILGVLVTAGVAHFAEIKRAIPGISERILSDRLAELTTAGLVTREVIEGPPLGVRYRVTASGEALKPALIALGEWASVHMAGVRAATGK
jgi:DNA-binding HxlR family transcriptional regulator